MALTDLKVARSVAKRNLTMRINATTVLLSEGEIGEIKKDELHKLYRTFVTKHEEYFEVAMAEKAETEEQLDAFLEAEQKKYFIVMQQVRDALIEKTAPDQQPKIEPESATGNSSSSVDLSREELLGVLSINSTNYSQAYDGDPMLYHIFMMSFDQTVDKVADPHHKLTHLLRFTTGEAHHAIEGCAIIGGIKGYERAREILKSRFGDKNKFSRSIMQHLMKNTAIRNNTELQKLADDLITADLTFDSMSYAYDSQELILKIVARLSKYHSERWRKYALDYKVEKGDYPKFKAFVKFVQRSAIDANDPIYGYHGYRNESTSNERKARGYSHLATGGKAENLHKKNHNCPKCKGQHRLYLCDAFKSVDVNARLTFVKENHLCFNCLFGNHCVSNCRSPVRCTICKRKHNTLLHVTEFNVSDNVSPHIPFVGVPVNYNGSPGVESGQNTIQAVSNLSSHTSECTDDLNRLMSTSNDIMLPLIGVTVNDKIFTYALLDSASTHTFVTTDLVSVLALKGTKTKLNLSTMNKNGEIRTRFFPLKLSSDDGKYFNIPRAYEVSNIPVPRVIRPEYYPHLYNIPNADPSNVTILIGQDCSECLIPLKVRRGQPGEPYAMKTMLGWCVCGPVSSGNVTNSGVSMLISADQHKNIQDLWEMDQEGTSYEGIPMSIACSPAVGG